MAYRVIKNFLDLEDGNHRYTVGDTYPRSGLAPTKERRQFLLSNQNLLHEPVIEEVDDFEGALNEPVEQGTDEDAAEGVKKAVNAVSYGDAKEYKPKRTRRSKTANKE